MDIKNWKLRSVRLVNDPEHGEVVWQPGWPYCRLEAMVGRGRLPFLEVPPPELSWRRLQDKYKRG